MSANVNGKGAAGRGGKGQYQRRQGLPMRKGFVSNHSNESMRKATFDMGHVADATQYVKSMETFVGFVGRSGQNNTDHL